MAQWSIKYIKTVKIFELIMVESLKLEFMGKESFMDIM